MASLGDFATSTVVYGKFTTYRPSTGATFTLGGTPALSVYKDNSTTQSTTGVTLTADFDSVTGLNHFAIDTSADGTFYSSGSFFDIVITTGTVDSVSVTGTVVGSFTLNKNSALKPTTAGRTLDVSAGGEAGVDWANVGSPTTTVNLSGTTTNVVNTATAVTTVNGLAANTITATSIASNAITAAKVATDAIGAAQLAADAVAEIADAVWDEDATAHQTQGTFGQAIGDPGADTDTIWGLANTNLDATVSSRLATAGYTAPLDAAGTRTAVGLASANLDTQLSTIDTVVDAVKAKTDSLTFTVAGQVDANIQSINDVTIVGDGSAVPFNV